MVIVTLCLEFFRTGLFAIGGGLATLPFLTQMCVDHPEWYTREMLANIVAVGQSTPGPMGINMATYVGYLVAGIPGSILATVFMAMPAVIIIIILAKVLQKSRQNKTLNDALFTLHPAVAGLIAAAGYSMLQLALTVKTETDTALNWVSIALFAVMLALILWKKLKKVHPIIFIAAGAAFGIVLGL